MKLLKNGLALILTASMVCCVPITSRAAENDNVGAGIVNPIYEDLIEMDEAGKKQTATFAYAPAAQAAYKNIGDFTDKNSAVEALRQAMVDREEYLEFTYYENTPAKNTAYDDAEMLMDAALTHTGVSNEGDYLNYNWVACYWDESSDETNPYTIRYEFIWLTSTEEEQYVTDALDDIYASFNWKCTSDYTKMHDIYAWVNDNVEYDDDHPEDDDVQYVIDASYWPQYTAYAAIKDGKAVCQGYATLMYRMCNDNGIDCRIVFGQPTGNPSLNHSWNLTEIKNAYYFCDATWDCDAESEDEWEYFLIGENELLLDHVYESLGSAYTPSKTNYVTTSADEDAQHTFTDWKTTVTATCTEDGIETATCECGETTQTRTIAALGHDWDDGVITVKPTTTSTGVKTYTCQRCGATGTETLERLTENTEASDNADETSIQNDTESETTNETEAKTDQTQDESSDTETEQMPVVEYTITAKAGEEFEIQIQSDSEIDIPEGIEIVSTIASDDGVITYKLKASDTGEYEILITNSDGSQIVYKVTIEETEAADDDSEQNNENTTGTLNLTSTNSEDSTNDDGTKEDVQETTATKTGENTASGIAVMLLIAAALSGTVIYTKKRKVN